MIPYGKQSINKDDIKAVVNVLQSDFLTQGPQVPLFEKVISKSCGSRFGVAVNSSTSALHIACLALNLEKGDWLWTSPNTFVASANCGLYCNAKVDFVDIDEKTHNISVLALKKKLVKAKKNNKLPKIVIPVHFSGQSCDMRQIYSLSKKYGFKIIEDASHALGGKYFKSKVGSCKYSDITVFSFHPVKIITTGEGGIATTNKKRLFDKMQLLRTHGITRDLKLMSQKPDGDWFYQQKILGFNYRMTDLQAALGLSQFKRLKKFVSYRNKIVKFYDKSLKDSGWILPYIEKNKYSACHLYVVRLPKKLIHYKKKIFSFLRKKNIGVNVHYIPVHTQPYYKNNKITYNNLENAENYYKSAISIPVHYGLKKTDQMKIINILKDAINMNNNTSISKSK